MGYPAEYQEVRWMEILSEILADVENQYSEFSSSSYDDIKGAWNLIPQWLEVQHRQCPMNEVYDIGCGLGILGAFAAMLNKGCHVSTIDADPLSTSLTIRRKYGLHFEVCDICQSAFMIDAAIPNVVDAIIFTDVIQFLQHSPVQVLKLFHKILKSSGVLYVSCPDASGNHGKVFNYVTGYTELRAQNALSLDPVNTHEVYWNYTKQEVLEIASKAGFRLSRFGYSVTSKGSYLNFAFTK